jgi:hypothetical protein
MMRALIGGLILLAGAAALIGVAKQKYLGALQETMREYQTMPSWSPFLNVRHALPDVGDLVPLSSTARYSTIQPNEIGQG